MTIENKISLLEARFKRLNARSITRDNAGVRRKLERQITSLTKAMENEQRQEN